MAPSAVTAILICAAVVVSVNGSSYYGSPPTYGSYGSSPSPPTYGGSSPPQSSEKCTVTVYMNASPWSLVGQGPPYADALNFLIQNTGSEDIKVPWILTITNPAYKSIQQAPWNWQVYNVSSGGVITGRAEDSWETLSSSAGNSVDVGLIVGGDSDSVSAFTPKSAAVNGSPCKVIIS